MLTERYSFSLGDNTVETMTVDEILESYEIKDLNLPDLQEKYVNTVDDYEEKLKDMEDKYENLENSISTLEDTISELKVSIEESNNNSYALSNGIFSKWDIILTVIVVFLVGLLVGKKINKNK